MAKLGLNQDQLKIYLSEALVDGHINEEKLISSIAEAIIKNNEAIEEQVTKLVSGNLMDLVNNNRR